MNNLLLRFKNHNRLNLTLILISSAALSVFLVAFRIYYSGHITYAFLVWNLLLAFIPFIISSAALLYMERIKSKLLLLTIIFSWLLFFPNAPYIVTDFFHLSNRGDVPLWYDMGLLISFSWNGLMLGFISLYDIQHIINDFLGKLYGWAFAIVSIILGSFGIYLGRFQRWNSWDIIANPFGLAADIAGRLLNPFAHPRTMLVTLLFSIFLIFGYLTLVQLINIKRSALRND